MVYFVNNGISANHGGATLLGFELIGVYSTETFGLTLYSLLYVGAQSLTHEWCWTQLVNLKRYNLNTFWKTHFKNQWIGEMLLKDFTDYVWPITCDMLYTLDIKIL